MDAQLQSKMISQSVTAAMKAFALEDFDVMNVLSNRVMSDAVFSNNGLMALPGFLLKDVATTCGALKGMTPPIEFSSAKRVVKEYLDGLSGLAKVPDRSDELQLWESFHRFKNGIRTYLLSGVEKAAYQEDPEISHAAFKWLIGYLNEKKEVLFDLRNQFLQGIFNEMDRLYREYGCKLADSYAMALVIALDRYFQYFRIQYAPPTGVVNEEPVRKVIFPYIERITVILSSEQVNPNEVGDVLWELIKVWRESFIQYMELPVVPPRSSIQLPEEARKKLAKAVGKAVERQAKT